MKSIPIRKNYLVESSHGEVYTGGPAVFHPFFRALITPRDTQVNTIPLENSYRFFFPIEGDDSKVVAVAAHSLSGKVAVAFLSGMIRVYEPILQTDLSRSSVDGQLATNADHVTADPQSNSGPAFRQFQMRYKWHEVSKWKCNHVLWLSWDNFNIENPLIAAASADGTVKVFDQVGSYCCHNFRGHSAPVTFCKFDELPKNDVDHSEKSSSHRSSSWWLFSAGHDYTLRVWSLIGSKEVAILRNNTSLVTDISFINHDPKARKLVTVGRDQIITIYNMDKKFTVYTTIPVFESLESCIVLSPNWHYPRHDKAAPLRAGETDILVAGESGQFKIWNIQTAECVYEAPPLASTIGTSIPQVDYLLLTPLAISSSTSDSKETKKSTPSEHKIDDHADHLQPRPNEFDLLANPIRSDLNYFFVSITDDLNMTLFDLESMQIQRTIVGYNENITDLVYINQDEIAVATNSCQLRLFSLPMFNSRILMTPIDQPHLHHKQSILALSVSPCFRWIITASKDQTLILWSVEESRAYLQLTGHTGAVTCVKFFNRNSRYICSGSSDHTIKIWDVGSITTQGKLKSNKSSRQASTLLTCKAHMQDVNCLAISLHDQYLASAGQDKEIHLYRLDNLAKHQLISDIVLKGHKRGIWDIQFSPVDQVIASCSADQTIKLWSLNDSSCIKTFQGHTASVLRVAFIMHGLQLVTSGADSLVKLWAIHDNECINTFDKHEEKIWGLAVQPNSDGTQFITGGSDSMICLWQDHTKQDLEAEARLKDENVIHEQKLQNLVHSKRYNKALLMAIDLDKPFQTLHIFQELLVHPIDEKTQDANMRKQDQLSSIIIQMNFLQIEKLLGYIKDWNTNTHTSSIAQSVLYLILDTFDVDSLLFIPQIKPILQALIPYTERHLKRVEKTIQNTYMIDYTLQIMNLIPNEIFQDEKKEEGNVDSIPAGKQAHSALQAAA